MFKIKTILFLIISKVLFTKSAKILGVISMPTYSHQVVYQSLWKELSLRGHQVTVLTSHPIKDPQLGNLTEIDLSFTSKMLDERIMKMIENDGTIKVVQVIADTFIDISDVQLSHPEVQKIINDKDEHFDLVMSEPYMSATTAFSVRFNCPLIVLYPTDAIEFNYQLVGNPSHPVLNPGFALIYKKGHNLLQRVGRTIFTLGMNLIIRLLGLQAADVVVRKNFGDGYPPTEDIIRGASLSFLNTNFAFRSIRPVIPSLIFIGSGIHRRPPKPLPKDLQEYLDNSSHGFIYFSMGCSVKGKNLDTTMYKPVLETFAKLPYNVLWKFEQEDVPDKPENVMISKWFPQQDIFKHPNIKLFITQGGLQSLEEAIYDHIPILGLPLFADQHDNLKFVVFKGMGLYLDFNTLNKTTFNEMILELINNPKYRNNAKQFATLSLDQPLTGVKKAIWWTEYVLRHKGAKHFKSPLIDIPFYQYYLLDMIGFCLLCAATVIFVLVNVIKLGCKLQRKRKCKSE